ncbi:hypothetical protein [Pseudomonas sp. ZS1P83]
MFAAMVIAMTLMVSAFIVAWWFSPELQRWSEAPKQIMLERERRYLAAAQTPNHP